MLFRAKPTPCVVEEYRDYTPPVDLTPIILRLLRGVKRSYYANLQRIVLTTSDQNPETASAMMRAKRNTLANRKETGYYRKRQIWLYVDSILIDLPQEKLNDRRAVRHAVANALFHELGRHIHRTIAPERGNDEKIENRWAVQLYLGYMMRCHWFRMLPGILLAVFIILREIAVRLVRSVLTRIGVPLKPRPAPV
jgi:hypothetical protein